MTAWVHQYRPSENQSHGKAPLPRFIPEWPNLSGEIGIGWLKLRPKQVIASATRRGFLKSTPCFYEVSQAGEVSADTYASTATGFCCCRSSRNKPRVSGWLG